MHTPLAPTCLLTGAVCLLGLLSRAAAEEPQGLVAKPLLVLTGIDTRVEKSGYHRITSDVAFQKLWLKHLGKTADDIGRVSVPVLTIDFDRTMVVAIFQCKEINRRGVEVVSITDGKDAVTVRFEKLGLQTEVLPPGLLGAPAARLTPTYAFVVLPKSEKAVIVEESVRGLKGEAPSWTERARLEGWAKV